MTESTKNKRDIDTISDDLDALKSDFAELLKHVQSGPAFRKALTRQVEKKPLGSLLITLGVGFIISRILPL
jgi:type IV secretory pathway VirD2 relaxase